MDEEGPVNPALEQVKGQRRRSSIFELPTGHIKPAPCGSSITSYGHGFETGEPVQKPQMRVFRFLVLAL